MLMMLLIGAKRFFDVTGIEYPDGYDRNVPKEAGLLG